MPAEPNASRFAPLSGTRVSDPSIEQVSRSPAVTARQSCSRCSASIPDSSASRSCRSGPGPMASRQVEATVAVGTRYGRCHGTSARSPMRASITSA